MELNAKEMWRKKRAQNASARRGDASQEEQRLKVRIKGCPSVSVRLSWEWRYSFRGDGPRGMMVTTRAPDDKTGEGLGGGEGLRGGETCGDCSRERRRFEGRGSRNGSRDGGDGDEDGDEREMEEEQDDCLRVFWNEAGGRGRVASGPGGGKEEKIQDQALTSASMVRAFPCAQLSSEQRAELAEGVFPVLASQLRR